MTSVRLAGEVDDFEFTGSSLRQELANASKDDNGACFHLSLFWRSDSMSDILQIQF